MGDLGLLNLEKFSRALRLRWLWHEWVSPEKAWVGSDIPCDDTDRLLFAACTTITIGDGKKTKSWQSGWLHGRRPRDIAPNLFKASKRKCRTVADALQNSSWIREIRNTTTLSITHLVEFVQLWGLVRQTVLQNGTQDTIKWKLSATGEYSTASAYKAQFLGTIAAPNLYLEDVGTSEMQILCMAYTPKSGLVSR